MNEELLLGRIARILNVETLTPAANFFDLGGDSLAALELVEVLRDEYSATVDAQTVLGAATFREMFDDIARSRAADDS